jgi:imidazolonepropionase-like amidohydrolase
MSSPDTVVISGGTALVGRRLEPLDAAAIVLSGNRIAALGSAAEVEVPANAVEVDARGKTLIPGFIDAHVHIGLADPAGVLKGGVTTARDLAWPPDLIWPLVERSGDEVFGGPRLLAAGQMLTVDGGYPTRAAWAPPGTGRVVASPAGAADAVAEQASAGASVIKVALNAAVGPTLDLATLRAIVDAGHVRGLGVTGHIYGLDELDKALDAGLDELAHMLMSPEPIPQETIARMVARDVVVVPTLSIFFDDDQEIAIENSRRFVAAGGRIVYGTDLGNEGPEPGIDPREVDALARAGLSGRQIISSATVESADYLGLESAGVLERGMAADIVAVDGDPLAVPSALTRVRMVWRAGHRVR